MSASLLTGQTTSTSRKRSARTVLLGILVAALATLLFQAAPAAAAPDAISLDPASDVNPVGTDHTVEATVTEAGSPSSGVQVLFFFESGANCGQQYYCDSFYDSYQTTGVDGKASFTFHGYVAGSDTIKAVLDANADFVADPGELSDIATNQWIVPAMDMVTLTLDRYQRHRHPAQRHREGHEPRRQRRRGTRVLRGRGHQQLSVLDRQLPRR